MEFIVQSFVHTADADHVGLQFEGPSLVLSFRDWQETSQRLKFEDVLAFRWQEFDEVDIRDDVAYEVVGSPWLRRQAELQGVPPERFVHYKLCFNAAGMLDVLCRPIGTTAS